MKNEVRVNVLNQPYGTFPWIDLPMTANENWYNAHNFYGELKDLEAATLEDASAFFKTFYAPNNAVLVVPATSTPTQTRRGPRSTSPASDRRSAAAAGSPRAAPGEGEARRAGSRSPPVRR